MVKATEIFMATKALFFFRYTVIKKNTIQNNRVESSYSSLLVLRYVSLTYSGIEKLEFSIVVPGIN